MYNIMYSNYVDTCSIDVVWLHEVVSNICCFVFFFCLMWCSRPTTGVHVRQSGKFWRAGIDVQYSKVAYVSLKETKQS